MDIILTPGYKVCSKLRKVIEDENGGLLNPTCINSELQNTI